MHDDFPDTTSAPKPTLDDLSPDQRATFVVKGALKIENSPKELFIGGAKNYRTEATRKIKGIPHSAKEIETGVFQFDSFIRQTSHMRAEQIKGAQVKTVTRELRAIYNKGIILKSGKVKPFTFPLP